MKVNICFIDFFRVANDDIHFLSSSTGKMTT